MSDDYKLTDVSQEQAMKALKTWPFTPDWGEIGFYRKDVNFDSNSELIDKYLTSQQRDEGFIALPKLMVKYDELLERVWVAPLLEQREKDTPPAHAHSQFTYCLRDLNAKERLQLVHPYTLADLARIHTFPDIQFEFFRHIQGKDISKRYQAYRTEFESLTEAGYELDFAVLLSQENGDLLRILMKNTNSVLGPRKILQARIFEEDPLSERQAEFGSWRDSILEKV